MGFAMKSKKMVSITLALLLLCCLLPACDKPGASGGSSGGALSGASNGVLGSAGEDSSGAPTGASDNTSLPYSASAAWIEAQLSEQDSVLWVYRDFADGLNNFTQKAWMGDSNFSIPAMDEASQGHTGITGITGVTGITGIAAELDLIDHSWGGYMFLNGTLKAGETVAQPGFNTKDAGLDLTGAQRLVFYARGETGEERVEFFLGGRGWLDGRIVDEFHDSTPKVSLGVVKLTREWQRFEIPLAGIDLSNIGCGFGWVANDINNRDLQTVRFYLDDIRYEYAEARSNPMFLASYGFAQPGTDESIINNFAYLYDNALAVLALCYAGNYERAAQIADAIVYACLHDRYYEDGRLRNAYSSGDPRSFPGWKSVKDAEFARLPGFYDAQSREWYEDYYAVSTSTGNLAWAMLALCEISERATQPNNYLQTARVIGDFILTLKDDRGGFTGGFEGWEPNAVRVTYKSTEHNIDLITAFGRLYNLTGDEKYRDASLHAKAFVLSMYDADRGCFYTGTTADGVTINCDVLPLDCNTWAILALGDDFKDAEKVLAFIEANMAVDGGYDFNEDRDGVWFEGTAQVALAYKQVGNSAQYEKGLAFLNQNASPNGSITAADRDGVSTGFMVSGMDIPWNYGKRLHLGATAWLSFAQMGVNPLAIDGS